MHGHLNVKLERLLLLYFTIITRRRKWNICQQVVQFYCNASVNVAAQTLSSCYEMLPYYSVHNSVLCPPNCYYCMHSSLLYPSYNICVHSAVCALIIVLCTMQHCALIIITTVCTVHYFTSSLLFCAQ